MSLRESESHKLSFGRRVLYLIEDNYRSVLVILGFFLVWEVLVRLFHVPEVTLPTPSNSLAHLFFKQADANYHWALNIRITLAEFILAFLITSVSGIALSILIVWSRHAKNILMPVFIFINSLPVIAIAPLIVIWMGYGITTNMFVAFLVGFFPVVINSKYIMDLPPVFASLIIISVSGGVLFLIITVLERLLMPWVFTRERL
ncbi:MAG: hypothetical protein LBC62_07280 [Treponema sp.]|jgi:ABC-type nitrate/sulfonate/bicarbonate transport system permease component|nr:hypothetical protein [Treponema sp.]